MKQLYLLIFMMLFSPIAQAEISFARLTEISPAPDFLMGSFSQEKYLDALDATLTSTGMFSYQRGKAIHWKILQPVQNELTMTPTAVTNKQGDQELLRLDADSNPAIRLIGEIFFAVLTAEWEALEKYFELSGAIDGQQWHAILVPNDQAIKQVFSRIELKGHDLLEEVVLYETSGDRTTIHLVSQK